jgi:hypothetical protein
MEHFTFMFTAVTALTELLNYVAATAGVVSDGTVTALGSLSTK